MVEIPCCEENEKKSKDFLKSFYNFTGDNFRLVITWKTRKIRTLFPIKEKSLYPSCKIYYGICDGGGDYAVETKRNTKTRWSEYNNPEHNSRLARHIFRNVGHIITWTILAPAPKKRSMSKNLEEEFFILQLKPLLNEQR